MHEPPGVGRQGAEFILKNGRLPEQETDVEFVDILNAGLAKTNILSWLMQRKRKTRHHSFFFALSLKNWQFVEIK